MISKKQLKTELNLPTVAVIGEILKAAGRDPKGQQVEDADADLVRKAVPYWRKGHDYDEAVRLAKAEHTAVDGQQPANGNGNGKANSALTLQNQTMRQTAALDKRNEMFAQKATLSKAVGDEKKNQALYWYARAAAAASPQVQESEEVTEARDFYFQMASGNVSGADFVADMGATLDELGFFGSELESLLPADDSSFSSPDASSYANGEGSESWNGELIAN